MKGECTFRKKSWIYNLNLFIKICYIYIYRERERERERENLSSFETLVSEYSKVV